ncbi:SMI1/KNR4 family protein [Bacillus sp. 166amftsu]|uniref:SMI1/KNR4 family protein n=1 Tax=Bacillus sp. 166amftsu TaxID=1761753 RepID=UPI00089D63CF|nr:SMI1/KNR4 family protein [Bacillus sp. 166amftsu]SDY79175.1 SMI1 / KNR4 family (SUKH-1) [Bacillus sp. 166amftsu]
MSNFHFLKQYVILPGTEISSDDKHVFYPTGTDEIKSIENEWGEKFPRELKQFYNEIGYGFVCKSIESRFNRIMGPGSVLDFINGEDIYMDDIRLDHYTDENELVFYEVSELSCLVMNLDAEDADGCCPIYYEGDLIANSLGDFLRKMNKNPNYYLKK